ncbi:hypothetical protein ACFLRB_03670 [Acidobacteriota bacterium]
MKKCLVFSSLLLLLLLFFGCDKGREVRKYQKKETSQTAKTTPGQVQFQWDVPQGWEESRTTSGMRLASFSVKSQGGESLCTIIPLKGTAGGIRANVIRWFGQINAKMEPGNDDLEKFLAGGEEFRTKGNFPAFLYDFTGLTRGQEDQSILVTIITFRDSSIFIKMTGKKTQLIKNKSKFKSLSQSFRLAREK